MSHLTEWKMLPFFDVQKKNEFSHTSRDSVIVFVVVDICNLKPKCETREREKW